MSTKITDGRRLHVASVSELGALLAATRAALEPAYEAAYRRLVVALAVGAVDRGGWDAQQLAELRHPTPSPLFDAERLVAAAHRRSLASPYRFPQEDLECEIFVFADPAAPEGPFLARLVTEVDEYEAALARVPGIEPWPYWDNTDKPDDVTEEEWEERRRAWERASAPGAPLVRWALIGHRHRANMVGTSDGELLALAPSPYRRAELLASLVPDDGIAADGHVDITAILDAVRVRAEQIAPRLAPPVPAALRRTRLPRSPLVTRAEHEWNGRRVVVSTFIGDEPPDAPVAAAHCIAFHGERVVLVRHLERGFTIPGGHVERGETPEQAAVREAREEGGLEIARLRRIGWERVEAAPGERPDPRYPSPSCQLFYVADVVGFGEILARDECDAVAQFSAGEAAARSPWVASHRALWREALRVVGLRAGD